MDTSRFISFKVNGVGTISIRAEAITHVILFEKHNTKDKQSCCAMGVMYEDQGKQSRINFVPDPKNATAKKFKLYDESIRKAYDQLMSGKDKIVFRKGIAYEWLPI